MANIKKFEAMAKLDLPEEERRLLNEQADIMIAGFGDLEKINTDSTEPLVTVLAVSNVMRNDIARKKITREELLSGAPEQHEGYIRVPKTID